MEEKKRHYGWERGGAYKRGWNGRESRGIRGIRRRGRGYVHELHE